MKWGALLGLVAAGAAAYFSGGLSLVGDAAVGAGEAAAAGGAADAAAGGFAAANAGLAGGADATLAGAGVASATGAGTAAFAPATITGSSAQTASASTPWLSSPVLGGALAGGSNLIGGVLANRQAADQAANQQAFQASQTGTAYQRAVADMKAAGLNPMLAYSQGGASSGTGAMAPVQNLGGSVSSAVQAASQLQGMEAVDATIKQTTANTDNIRADTVYKAAQTQLAAAQTTASGSSARNLDAATDNAIAATQGILADSAVKSGTQGSRIRGTEAEAKISEYGVPRARALGTVWDALGAAPAAAKLGLDALSSSVGTARDAARVFTPFY